MPQPEVELEEHKAGLATGSSQASVHKSEASATVDDISTPPIAGAQKAERSQASEPPASADFPEGGWAGWSTVFGAFLLQMCGFGYTGSYGVYQDFYTRVYLSNQTSSAISWIGSINGYLVISSGLVAGRLYDRGYFYHLLYGGSLLLAFSLFMLSLAKPGQYYQIFLSQGLGVGIGAGMMYIPSVAIVSQYFLKKRALAMTIVASGSSLGAVVHPIMLNNTLNDPEVGFALAARANAGVVAGLLLIACVLMRTRTTQLKQPPNLWASAKRFVRDGAYVFASVGMTVFAMGFYFPLFYLQLDALTHGLDKTFSFYSLVILNACSFLGRISPGFVANKLGVENITVVTTFVCAVLILGMIGLSSVASVVVIAVIYGFFSGTYIAMLAPLLTHLTDDMSEHGARMGIAFALAGFGTLTGPPIDGALLTGNYIWWRPSLFSGVSPPPPARLPSSRSLAHSVRAQLMAFLGFASFSTSIVLLRRRKMRRRAQEAAAADEKA
ncbi:major facilitator superfamily domain-containing protein [Trametes punicea]|nr:major facilitator superfamily domain-containing protein [Trametes punicea]